MEKVSLMVFQKDCMGCHACEVACKQEHEAIYRDALGIVLINQYLCIGCKACVEACPFGAMQFDDEREFAVKCDLCGERLSSKEQPACAKACPSQCIFWGDIGRLTRHMDQRLLESGRPHLHETDGVGP
jgi:Fe-S-cluster-containing dehydrogenase component